MWINMLCMDNMEYNGWNNKEENINVGKLNISLERFQKLFEYYLEVKAEWMIDYKWRWVIKFMIFDINW